jgi:hypothetical protein
MLKKATPFIRSIVAFFIAAYPWYVQAAETCKKVDGVFEYYSLYELLPAAVGLFLALFGGRFALSISAYEAFRQVGYAKTKEAVDSIKRQLHNLEEQNMEDDEEDLDNDGIADVEQISEEELYRRKIILVMTTVDPDDITDAIGKIIEVI